MIERTKLLQWCHDTLEVDKFQDYAPNGLQVEGSTQVKNIVCAVTASRSAIQATIDMQADTLLVHHGMFWKNEITPIIGWKKERIQLLLKHNINLIAYHLPLDAHIEYGNNVTLAQLLNWEITQYCHHKNLMCQGILPTPMTLTDLSKEITTKLNRPPLIIGDKNQIIHKIAWCTGGAQGFFQQAIDAGVDAYITGEVSEAQFHLAHENKVAFISAGHHATERYGIQALARGIQKHFNITFHFFDENNPV